jgi:beta-alanine--pyruvate transaminase
MAADLQMRLEKAPPGRKPVRTWVKPESRRDEIYEAFMQGPEAAVELAHGFTYSGHPLAAAAGCAALEVYADERLFQRVRELEPYWEQAVHGLRGLAHVIDIRNFGLLAAVELEPLPGKPGLRGMNVFDRCYEEGLIVRAAGDNIALSPSLILERQHIDAIVGILRRVLSEA